LPDKVTYGVPPEVANKIRDAKKRKHKVDPHATTTLAQPLLARVTYMDVGCWGGSAPKADNTTIHWGKKRYFGVVFGRLSVLCEYRPWEQSDEAEPRLLPPEKSNPFKLNLAKLPEYDKVLPLLKALSTNPGLGQVVVTKVIYNDHPAAVAPPDDRIHVILGDLHAPVMTDQRRTRADVLPDPYGWNESNYPGTIHQLPGAYMQAAQQLGVIRMRPPAKYPLRGRYDRGVVAPALVPLLSRLFGEGAKFVVHHETAATVAITTVAVPYTRFELAMPLFVPTPARVVFGATGAALGSIAAGTRLRRWSADEAVDMPVVDDWFDRYHGTGSELGADVFDGAGVDLLAWLRMLKTYQASAGGVDGNAEKPPVRLMQLGDLFDFWIGLQCPFDLLGGAREFPDPASASKFVNHWLSESLRNPAIEFLWKFDEQAPPVTDDRLKTVFLYGNHDTYMGTSLLRARAPLLGQFVEPGMGLIAQHGHQDDLFNAEPTAGIGYLLTQAVFVRTIEDPMSSLKTKLFGGMWTRLGYDEAALKNCLFQRLDMGARPAATFVMGHTHEPALQRVDVIEVIPAKPDVSPAPPQERPIPPRQICRPGKGADVRGTVTFKQVHVLDHGGDEPWNIRAFVSPISKKNQGGDVTLVDEVPIKKGETRQLGDLPVSVSVSNDEQLEILIQGWQGHRTHTTSDPFFAPLEEFWNYALGRISDLTPNFLKSTPEFDVITVLVWPNTWDGTRTIKSKNLQVTFGLDWDT